MRPKVIRDEIKFFNIDECKQILKLADDYGLYHYVVLGLFGGIRPSELRRLGLKHIQLNRRIISLGADITQKTRRRIIELREGDPLGDCLIAWLSAKPLPNRIFAGNTKTYKRHFIGFRDRLGFPWIQDGLRHCAASYHYAFYGDIAKTCKLLGDCDSRIILEHYAGMATKAESEQFYALRPTDIHGNFTAIGSNDVASHSSV